MPRNVGMSSLQAHTRLMSISTRSTSPWAQPSLVMMRLVLCVVLLASSCTAGSDGPLGAAIYVKPLSATGVLFETATGRQYLCDTEARSLCSVGLVLDLSGVETNALLDTTSVVGRRSGDLVTIVGADSSAGFVVSELGIADAGAPRLRDQPVSDLGSFFDQGPPVIDAGDLIEAPICGGKLVEVGNGTENCPVRTTVLGFNPLAWKLVERNGTTIRLDTQEGACASGGDQPDRRRELLVVEGAEGLSLVVLITLPTDDRLTCAPNEVIEVGFELPPHLVDTAILESETVSLEYG